MAEDITQRLQLVVALAQNELAAQVVQESGLDTKAAGLAGLAAVLVAGVAATSSTLGRLWLVPFSGFVLALILALASLFTDPLTTGPRLRDFYEEIKRKTAPDALREAIEDLLKDINKNRELLRTKRTLLQNTTLLFFAVFAISIPLVLATRG